MTEDRDLTEVENPGLAGKVVAQTIWAGPGSGESLDAWQRRTDSLISAAADSVCRSALYWLAAFRVGEGFEQ
ncbi:MAG: hypothetical protein FWC87_01200 [Acidimicrobiaceae bacterium]|nr:hypothetical protein [Acidimicrobiaceae bacterium]